MKNFAIKAVVLGIAAAFPYVTPAQAASISTTTTKNNGTETISPAAFRIENLEAPSGSSSFYNISFKFGDFNTIYAGNPNPFSEDQSFSSNLGNAIISTLTGTANQVISDSPPGFTIGGTFGNFLLPVSALGSDSNDSFLDCALGGTCNLVQRADTQRNGDNLIYATYVASSASPSGGGTAIPTPAMIPGLLGMGWATLRKKQRHSQTTKA